MTSQEVKVHQELIDAITGRDEEVLAVPPGTTITDAHFGRTGAAGCPPMPGLAR